MLAKEIACSKVAALCLICFLGFVTEARGVQAIPLEIPPFRQQPERSPEHPLKTARMIYTGEDMIVARRNINRYPGAKKIRDGIVMEAEKWLAWDDKDIVAVMADARVPRAFELHPGGCPLHGKAIFSKGEPYPWIIDPARPFQVVCPVGKETYPSNEYVDDGWGWVAPGGERYWFVAYANHWVWKKFIEPGLLNLGRAYLLTGDKRYAHKAGVMLYRLAEVYPSMDYAPQSRYGLLRKAAGQEYPGKVLNRIWETTFIESAAEAYDAIWDSIDDDPDLQKLSGRTGPEIRAFIEANLLEEALDAYFERKIQGNFGMHQSALLHVLLARQHMDMGKYLDMLVDEPGPDRPHMGLRYALYNQIFRDGLPLESPQYNMIWISRLAALGELLRKAGVDLLAEPRFRMIFDGPPALVAAGRHTVDWGDGGSALGGVQGRYPDVYQVAWQVFKDPRYLSWLAGAGHTGGQTFTGFHSLFREELPETLPPEGERAVAPQASRLFAGYGLGILNNMKDETALAFTYGPHIAHFHWDFLNIELFAGNRKIMPDLGYPDAMNAYLPEIYAWSKNTIAHNTVVVDAGRQDQNLSGTLHDFADGGFARVMDASAPAYSQTRQYRRTVIMVDIDPRQSYAVDFFRVSGGRQHDYSLHGPPGTVTTLEGTWSEKAPGTLAGPEVEVGRLYDDRQLSADDYRGGYAGYQGSGFQYLFNVQQLEQGKALLQYEHVSDPDARLRIHLLQPDPQQVYIADAYDQPRARTHLMKYLIARRSAKPGRELESNFVSVLEPYGTTPHIRSVQLLALAKGKGLAVEVNREDVRDIVISDTANTTKRLAAYDIETDAGSAVVSFDLQGRVVRVFFSGGSYLSCKGKYFNAQPLRGSVTAVDVASGVITVKPEGNDTFGSATDAAGPAGNPVLPGGRVAHFRNAYRSTVHPLAEIRKKGKSLEISIKDDLLTGLVRLGGFSGRTAVAATYLPFSGFYPGSTVLDSKLSYAGKLERVGEGKLILTEKPAVPLNEGDDVWLASLGIGDEMEIKPVFSWSEAP